jgi:hypothetical protein
MTLFAAGCGGGGGSVPQIGTGVGSGSGGSNGGTGGSGASGSSTNFANLSGAAMGVGDTRTFSPNEAGNTSGYSVTSSAPGVISVTPASGAGPFTLHALAAGTSTITVSDNNGHTSPVTIMVGAIGFGTLSSAPMNVGTSQTFTPTESGYTGTYTVTSSAPTVASVSPGTGTGPFTVTAVSPGTATITVTDTNGHTGTTTVTVAATATPTPVPSNAASPTPGPSSTPIGGGSPTPSPSTTPIGGGTATPSPATPTPTGAAVIGFTPTSLTPPLNGTTNVTVTDPNGTGSLTATVANPGIATVISLGGGVFEVSGNAAGTTTITFTDGSGLSNTIGVTVPASPAPLIALNPSLTVNAGVIGLGANVLTYTPTEAGYTGTFTVTSSDATIAAITNIGNLFVLATVKAGSVIITAHDTNGHTASIGYTVQ